MAQWLMKSEPASYSFDDLERDEATMWDGVRNNAARLHLRAMKLGDEALFYASVTDKAIVGIMRITGAGQPDGPDGQWVKVPVEAVRRLKRPITLAEIKADPALKDMELLRQSRLSVAPVREAEWDRIVAMSEAV